MASEAKRMKYDSFEPLILESVLPDKFYRVPKLVEANCLVINDAKNTSKVIKLVKIELEKSEKYSHLQMVKKVDGKIYVLIPEMVENLTDFGEILKCEIPEKLPFTIRENNLAKKSWPTKFKPNQETEFWWNFKDKIPDSIKIKAQKVADTTLGSKVSTCSKTIEIFKKNGEIYQLKNDTSIDQNKICKILDHKIMRSLRQFSGDYLCTNCIVILDQEPCIMCSMALLHSRVYAVIYIKQNPECGGLGSLRMINYNEKLNHKFHVLRGKNLK